MKADTIKFFDFLDDKKINYIIPVYQRNYEWNNDQCEQLFKDVENLIQDNNERKHFLGTIVYVYEAGEKQSKNYIIIDGQQRITSFMLLLKGIAHLTDNSDLQSEIEEDYLINPRVSGDKRIKLRPVEKDRVIYDKILEDKEVTEISKVRDNYQTFLKLIEESNYSTQELFEAMGKIEIVYIELNGNNESENPQIIFESINSTGLSLTASDLIRNFLLMGIDSDLQTKLYNEYWREIEKKIPSNKISTFIRFYLQLKIGLTVTESKIYEEFKRFFYNNHYTPEKAIKELELYSRYYHDISEETVRNNKVNELVKNINIMKATVVYPYLMELFRLQDVGNYSWGEVYEIVSLVQSYLFRRLVTDKKTNVLNKLFSSMSSKISPHNELERIQEELLNKPVSQVFPRNDEFIRHLTTIDLYNRRNNLAKLTLVQLERLNNKEKIEIDNIQVEHILPQKISDEWRLNLKNAEAVNEKYGNTIGNLTLTGYNPEISNRSFTEKAKFYKNSNISITRDIANEYNEWSEKTLKNRARKLAEKALIIWPIPDTIEPKNTELLSGEYQIDEMVNVTGTKPESVTLDVKEIKISSWTMMLVEFLNFVWEIDSSTFDNLIEKESLQRLFLNPSEFRSPKKLANGMLIETNYSANDILAIIRIVSKEYEIEEYVSYTIK